MMWAVTKVVVALAFLLFGLQPIIDDIPGASIIRSIGGRYEPPKLTSSSINPQSVFNGREHSVPKSDSAEVKKVTSLVALPVGAGGFVLTSFEATIVLALISMALVGFTGLIIKGFKIRRLS